MGTFHIIKGVYLFNFCKTSLEESFKKELIFVLLFTYFHFFPNPPQHQSPILSILCVSSTSFFTFLLLFSFSFCYLLFTLLLSPSYSSKSFHHTNPPPPSPLPLPSPSSSQLVDTPMRIKTPHYITTHTRSSRCLKPQNVKQEGVRPPPT